MKMYIIFSIFFAIISFINCKDENVLMTEVFEITIDPPLFNWTYEGIKDQYAYQASLLGSPDLPSWVNFVYSKRHHCGYLYGVPPNQNKIVPLEVVALNKKTYETRIENVYIHVTDKLNPARFEVHMKIDNLNVEDMFDVTRMENLKDIFRKQLWKDSEEDLYVTFLSSAIKLGARKPLDPNEGEGVVLRLGSETPFSSELIELQEEVRPLWKVPFCPRNFKRTSVERFFRDAGFSMDWCSFKLLDDNSAMHNSGTNEKLLNSKENIFENRWMAYSKQDVPDRSYTRELLVTIFIPAVLMVLLALVLTFVLCLESDDLHDEISEIYFAQIFHICTDYFSDKHEAKEHDAGFHHNNISDYSSIKNATNTLRHLNRELTLTPDPILLARNHTESPTSTISRGMHCRPSPPPYVRPKYKPDI